MRAILLASPAFQEHLVSHMVPLLSDSATVVVYVNIQGGIVSLSLCTLTEQIIVLTELLLYQADCQFFAGLTNVIMD